MHIYIITPAGKTVKVDVGDELDSKDVMNDKIIPQEESKVLDQYPSTSAQAQLQPQIQEMSNSDMEKQQKIPRESVKFTI
ncbi:hypothetical protein KR215_006124 [Drosophila sulfurigaster]|nr:hypothetical protein KR215_006124 [Drosophila sulfurigaster]